jgi:hypothetical protein
MTLHKFQSLSLLLYRFDQINGSITWNKILEVKILEARIYIIVATASSWQPSAFPKHFLFFLKLVLSDREGET